MQYCLYALTVLDIAVDCGDLDDPENGDVDLTGTSFGSRALYSCNRGFTLVGINRRVCQANGQWSGEAPSCARKIIYLMVTDAN